MSGKIIAIVIVVCAAVAAGWMYYLQVYGYYYNVTPVPGQDVLLVRQDSQVSEPILYTAFEAIDADSSPIRYRACFETSLTPDELKAKYVVQPTGEPRVAPGWFECFDAEAIGEAIESGALTVYLGEKNIFYGVDRVVGIGADGRGWVWHELNECGHKEYDGTVVGEECPARP